MFNQTGDEIMKYEFAMAEFYGINDVLKVFEIITGRNYNKHELKNILIERFCFHRDNGNNDFAFAYKDLLFKTKLM